MLSIDEVLVMAFPIWRDNQWHTRNPDIYPDEDVPKPMDAATALRIFEDQNPDPLFWESVDPVSLKSRFIAYMNYRLGSSGTTYDSVMNERRNLASQAA
jgi:hypothetical protein